MTGTEQSLAAALSSLKSAGYADLARMGLGGLPSARSAGERAALERMSLAAPSSLRDRTLRTLVLGACGNRRTDRTLAAGPRLG